MQELLKATQDVVGLEHDLFQPSWTKTGFNALKEIAKTSGPLVEIGGPTPKGYDLIDINLLPRKLYLSNMQEFKPSSLARPAQKMLDFVCDGKHLPLGNESTGAIFGSCLPRTETGQIFQSCWMALEKGGILVWQRTGYWIINSVLKLGFQLCEFKMHTSHTGSKENQIHGSKIVSWDGIFQKPWG